MRPVLQQRSAQQVFGQCVHVALAALAQESNAELPVLGDLTFSEAATGWIATWKMEADGRQFRWSVRGVNYDAAFRNGVLGVMRALSGNGKP